MDRHAEHLTDPPRSGEDVLLWRMMLERIERLMESGWHSAQYVDSFAWFRSLEPGIPLLGTINRWLDSVGWRAVYVTGYIPVRRYQELQAQRIFPLSWRIRRLRDIDHSAEPDFIHDVFGHLPMLFHERYRSLICEWAERGLQVTPTGVDLALEDHLMTLINAREQPQVNAEEVERITRKLIEAQAAATACSSRFFKLETFYTWAIEFGVIDDGHFGRKLIGAAALSSPGEMERIFSGRTTISSFADEAIGVPVDYTLYQKEIFAVRRFEDYFSVLRAI